MMRTPLGPGAEFDHIRHFLASARSGDPQRVLVGPGDDAAIIEAGRLAISSDMSLEGIHFRTDWLTPEQMGARAAYVALSDLAACAATPFGVLVSLAVSRDAPADLAEAIMGGLRTAAEAAGAVLLGGDLARSPGPIVIDVTTIGTVDHAVLRSGAHPGDSLWVTGTLGGAASAVRDLLDGKTPDPDALRAYTAPVARIREAIWLAQRGVPSAMIDLSDGLGSDAAHLAAASGARIVIDAPALPLHSAAALRGAQAALSLALGGGDDYELCFAARAGAAEMVHADFISAFGVPLTRVGEVSEGGGVMLREADGKLHPMPALGFDHFARRSA
jgi:thiamine-monophosphate kinase